MGQTEFGGFVVEINTNNPIAGVNVTIPLLGLQTITNAQGIYNFGIINWSNPQITLNLTHPNFHPVSRNVVLLDLVSQAENIGMLSVSEEPPPPGAQCSPGQFFCDGVLKWVCVNGQFEQTQEFCTIQPPTNNIILMLGVGLAIGIGAVVLLKKK